MDANRLERFLITAPLDRIGERFVCLDDFAKPLRRRPGAGIRMVASGKRAECRSNRVRIGRRRYIQYEVVVHSTPGECDPRGPAPGTGRSTIAFVHPLLSCE